MGVWLLILRILLAANLYAFLGAIFWLLWRDLRQPTSPPVQPPRYYGRLTVIGNILDASELSPGDERIDKPLPQPGIGFLLQPFTSIGRAASNTITLPDAFASSEHALLALRAGRWWLEDCGSRNGTQLNGVPINTPTVVSAGDVIGIGRLQLKLELIDSQ